MVVYIALIVCALGACFCAYGEQVIVTFGDSTTAPRGKMVVYSDVLKDKLAGQYQVINSGIGGNTTEMGRKRFESDVLAHNPAIVIIQFGINDSAVDVSATPPRDQPRLALDRYVENLNFFIRELQKKNARIILMTPNPMRWTEMLKKLYGKPPYNPDDADGLNATIKPYIEAVRKIAAEQNVELIDVYDEYAKLSTKGESIDGLLPDGMHPNEKAHRMVGEKLLQLISSPAKTKSNGSTVKK
jgi:lysophospholipase L1-like esterase